MKCLLLVPVVGCISTLLGFLPHQAHAQVRPPESIVVDRADDLDIRDCNATTSGDCTLRGALHKALPGDIIVFDELVFPPNITPPTTIAPDFPLPPISLDNITVWGTPSGSPRVRILGTNAGDGASGLHILSSNNFVRGLWIEGFSGAAIRVEGMNNTLGGISECGPSQAHILVKNRIGIHITGENADNNRIPSSFVGGYGDAYGYEGPPSGLDGGNLETGVLVDDGADDNGIGAGCYGIRIASNKGDGLVIRGADTTGNYFNDGIIGGYQATDGNAGHGVLLDGSSGFRMGHAVNIIGNGGDGVRITGPTARRNNISQTYDSAYIDRNSGLAINLVGGLEDIAGVTANDSDDSDTGPNGLLNAPTISAVEGVGGGQVEVRGKACASCTIRLYRATLDPSGHGEMGGGLTQTTSDTEGNWQATIRLGPGGSVTATATDMDGNTSELSKNAQGPLEIIVDRTDDTLVGNCTEAPSDCTLRGALSIAKRGDTINFAMSEFPNEYQPGIIYLDAPLPAITQGNLTLKADASRPRVWIDGSALPGSVDGLVLASDGNFIQGLRLMGFGGQGLVILGANNRIGWPECGSSNGLWLSGNRGFGAVVSGENADNNIFHYILVGSETGLVTDANETGGILVENGADGTSLGASSCYGPVVVGNLGSGIVLRGDGTEGTRLNSLTIGRQGAPNKGHGLLIEGGARTFVDYVASIEYNTGDGVRIEGGTGHTIRPTYSSSSIRHNGGLAINLVAPNDPPDGVTSNDTGDLDEGPNGLLNAPVIESVESLGGGNVRIRGTACPNCSVNLHLAEPDPSGYGELGPYIGAGYANAEGRWETQVSLGTNTFITALAYDNQQNTSEAARNVPGPRALVVDRTDDALVNQCTDTALGDCTLRGALATAIAGDTIRFHPDIFPPGNYYGPPTVTWVMLEGPLPALTAGRITIDAGQSGEPTIGIDGSSAGPKADGLVIRSDGNYVQGLRIANFGGNGIVIDGGSRNEIGRNRDICGPAGGNTLTDNGGYGIVVRGEDADHNNLRYNKLGFRPDNSSGPNALGGILIADGADDTGIGNGQCYGIDIHGNGGPGLTMRGETTTGAYIGEGYIGRPSNPNQGDGVLIEDASDFRTGWVLRIESNLGAGVRITGPNARKNRIMTPMYYTSTIRDNGGLAVDLVGNDGPYQVTANDRGDVDEGPNRLQNFPVVYWVRGTGDGNFTLKGQSCPSCNVNVFNAALDPSGHGEAGNYLGSTRADSFGIWQANVFLGAPGPDTVLTLQAVDPEGNMSEFGANVLVLDRIKVIDVCGNNTKETNESCDDGNLISGDGCSAICEVESCGDGITQAGLGEACDGGCDDGNACTVADQCDAACMGCRAGPPLNCDDGNPCTVDGCDPSLGCTHVAEACDDGNLCTVDRCDVILGCVHDASAPLEGVNETCDGKDDDCDGLVDNAVRGSPTLSVCALPETSLTSTPESMTASTSATFSFSGSNAVYFECQLDGGEWTRCDSGSVTYSVAAGGHTFLVRGLGSTHIADPTPAYYAWTVDATVPDTSIIRHPADPSQSRDARFELDASVDGATFVCTLDGMPIECDKIVEFANLSEGEHTFTAAAEAPNGLVDPIPATWVWHIDLSDPETLITSGPSSPTREIEASFELESPLDPDATFECSLDGAPFTECDATPEVSGLGEGRHTFEARAVDVASNIDPTPSTWTWVVDLTGPVVAIDSGPSDPSQGDSAEFEFSANEAADFFCALDEAADAPSSTWPPCDPDAVFEGLGEGAHELHVVGRDEAGNLSENPAIWNWHIALDSPETVITSAPSSVISQTEDATFSYEDPTGRADHFECQQDAQGWLPCDEGTSTWLAADLTVGAHRFEVRSCLGAICDPTPAEARFEVSASPCPRDADAPVLKCVPSLELECSMDIALGATDLLTSAEDACGAPTVTLEEPETYAPGENPVVVVAVDGNGNRASCVVPVTLTDHVPPELTCRAPVTVTAPADRCGADMEVGAPEVSDACDGTGLRVSSDAPATYPVGKTEVTFTASDRAGLEGSCEVAITVIDATPPVLACPESALNGELVPTAADACGATVEVDEVTCVATRPDGTEVILASSGCPAMASGDRVVLGGTLEGAFDGDQVEVRYLVRATDASANLTELRCSARADVSDLPPSPESLRVQSGAGCASGGRSWHFLVGFSFLGLWYSSRRRESNRRASKRA